jgi:REP element-mobilizing transposase RayT
MARPSREDYPGAWHHVMNRGRNRDKIFMDDDDAVGFLDAVGDTVERFDIEVHAFSLMPNHYHLLVRSRLGNLSDAMKHFGAVYTQTFNRRHRRDGALFRGRFKSQLVEYEAYLIYVLAYIHLNPLRAGLITRLDGLRGWTSHRRYMGKDRDPDWLVTEVIGGLFDTPEEMKELILKLHRKAEPWPRGMRKESGWFLWHLCPVDLKEKTQAAEAGDGVSITDLLNDICEITRVEMSRLHEPVRGPRGNPERRFAVWALQRSTYLTYRQIGELLEMTAQHVARDIRRSRTGLDGFSQWTNVWMERYPAKVSIV